MKKRIVSLLLAFLMVISVMPLSGLTAFAEHSSTVYVGGQALEPGEYITGDGAISTTKPADNYAYLQSDANEDYILTLHNFRHTGEGMPNNQYICGLINLDSMQEDLELILEGTSTLTKKSDSGKAKVYGIYFNGSNYSPKLTISGSGTLNINADTGIYVGNSAEFEMKSGTINIKARYNGFYDDGYSKTIKINGNLDIESGYSAFNVRYSTGAGSSTLEINGGSHSFISDSYVFNVLRQVKINGGSVVAKSRGTDPVADSDTSISAGDGIEILASTNVNGTGAAAYNAANKSTYKYLKTEEATETVTAVETKLMQIPATGKNIDSGVSSKVTPNTVHVSSDYATVYVCDSNSSNFSDWTEVSGAVKYEKDKYYAVVVGVRIIDNDAEYSSSVTKTIGGKAHDNRFDSQFENTDKKQTVVGIWGPMPAPVEATAFDMIVTEPVVWADVPVSANSVTATPAGSVEEYESGFHVCDENSDDIDDWDYLPSGSKFEAGKYYMFLGTVEAADGYALGSDITRKVNGEAHDTRFDSELSESEFVYAIRVWGPLVAPDIWVGGVGMFDGDYLANGASATTTEKPSGGYSYYKDGVLTLHDYEFEDECDLGYVVYCPKDLTIELEGENTLTNNESESAGIYADGNLTIGGEGSVAISADEGCILSDDLTIKDSCTVTADSLIWADTLTVQDDCALTLDGTDGISAYDDFVVTGGTVIITVNGDDDDGVYASNDVIISGGSVTVTAGNRGIYSHTGTVTISGGEVDVTAPNDNGIDAYLKITINGNVRVSAGGYGIKSVHRGIDVTGGSLEIKSTATGDDDADYYALSYSVGEGGKLSVAEGMSVLAATEVDGTFVEYDKDENNTYDHVKIGEETTPDPTVIESVEFTAAKEAPAAGEAQYTFELSKVNGSEAEEDLGLLSNNFEWYVSDTACADPYSSDYQSASGAFEAGKFYMIFIDLQTTGDDILFDEDCEFSLKTEGGEAEFDFDEIGENSDEAALAMFYEVEDAVTTYDVWVAGTQVTSENADDVLGDGAASYNPTTNTLTVKKNIAATGSYSAINTSYTTAFNIVIADDVTLSSENSGGINSAGALNISIGETSKLTIAAPKGDAVQATYGDITIEGGKLDITGNYGIYTSSGAIDLTVKEISIDTARTAILGYDDAVIDCDKLSVESDESGAISIGSGKLAINGSENSEITIAAPKGNAVQATYGDITIKGGKLDITGNYGIYTSSGTIDLTVKEISIETVRSAILGYDDATIDCDKLSVESDESGAISIGSGNLTINGSENSEIAITAPNSDAVQATYGDITIKGGKLDITGNYGIYTSSGAVDLTVKEISIETVRSAILGCNDSTIDCDELSVESSDSGAISIGSGKLAINGSENSEITIAAPNGDAVQATGGVTIEGGKLDITGNYGIYASSGAIDLTVKEISFEANRAAILSNNNISIDCDTALLVAGTLGISAAGSIIIEDGTFDVQSTDTSESEADNYALYYGGTFTYPSGATVEAATEVNGTFEAYDASKNATYDHVKIRKPASTTPTRPTTRPATKPTTTTTTTQPAPETQQTIERLAGDNRVDTAVEISKEGWDKADTVIIASSEKYPDALAGAALAENLNAPVLLNNSEKLEAAVLVEINRLGAKKVVILGGTAAISQDIENNLSKLFTVERISGDNRNATAAEIAGKLCDKSDIAFLVSNQNYADALSVSPVASLKGAPILYVNPDGSIPAETASALNKLGCTKVYIIGGTAAVGSAAETTLGKLSINVERVYGDDRYLTSVAVNKKFADVFTGKGISVATGKDFPDALAGAAFAAKNSIPVYLVSDDMPASAASAVKALGAETIFVFGGKAAVSDAAVAKIAK